MVYARVPKDVYKDADYLRKEAGQTWQGFITHLLKNFIELNKNNK